MSKNKVYVPKIPYFRVSTNIPCILDCMQVYVICILEMYKMYVYMSSYANLFLLRVRVRAMIRVILRVMCHASGSDL